MDIEAVLAEATDVAPEAKATEVAPPVETPQEPVEIEVSEEKPTVKPYAELTPEERAKREANRVARQSRYEARLKRTNRELLSQVEQLRAAQQPAIPRVNQANTGEPQPPKEEDFSDWESLRAAERQYYKDLSRWETRQELSERERKYTETSQAEKLTNYWEERKQVHAKKEAEFAKKVPDYGQVVYGDYGDFMNNLPLPVQEALIEADDASSALYALAMEGTLEDLEDLPPSRIALEIGRAEVRGQQYLTRKVTTNAPPPVESAKGTGRIGKDEADKSVEELMKKYN